MVWKRCIWFAWMHSSLCFKNTCRCCFFTHSKVTKPMFDLPDLRKYSRVINCQMQTHETEKFLKEIWSAFLIQNLCRGFATLLSKADCTHNRTLCDNVFSSFDTEQTWKCFFVLKQMINNDMETCRRHENFFKFWLIRFILHRTYVFYIMEKNIYWKLKYQLMKIVSNFFLKRWPLSWS